MTLDTDKIWKAIQEAAGASPPAPAVNVADQVKTMFEKIRDKKIAELQARPADPIKIEADTEAGTLTLSVMKYRRSAEEDAQQMLFQGSLSDGIRIYHDPHATDGLPVVIGKAKPPAEAAAHHCPYVPTAVARPATLEALRAGIDTVIDILGRLETDDLQSGQQHVEKLITTLQDHLISLGTPDKRPAAIRALSQKGVATVMMTDGRRVTITDMIHPNLFQATAMSAEYDRVTRNRWKSCETTHGFYKLFTRIEPRGDEFILNRTARLSRKILREKYGFAVDIVATANLRSEFVFRPEDYRSTTHVLADGTHVYIRDICRYDATGRDRDQEDYGLFDYIHRFSQREKVFGNEPAFFENLMGSRMIDRWQIRMVDGQVFDRQELLRRFGVMVSAVAADA